MNLYILRNLLAVTHGCALKENIFSTRVKTWYLLHIELSLVDPGSRQAGMAMIATLPTITQNTDGRVIRVRR